MKSLFNENYDWIIPINGYFQVILCRLVRKFKKTKILISGHAGIGRDDKFNILYGRPDVFVALTQKAYSWAAKFYNHDKIKLIPNGVNLDMFSKKGGKAKIPLKTPIILCVSAYVRYKRLDLLIKAVEKVPMASLLLIGDGPLYDSLNKMGSDLLSGRFLSIKHICHEDMPLYYRSSNLFSLPSRESEAFGLVYLEAMASNIPIVGPSDNHRKELIGNAGMLCEVEDETKYSETLIKALQKDFDSLPEKQANKYSWQTVAIEYDSLFKSS